MGRAAQQRHAERGLAVTQPLQLSSHRFLSCRRWGPACRYRHLAPRPSSRGPSLAQRPASPRLLRRRRPCPITPSQRRCSGPHCSYIPPTRRSLLPALLQLLLLLGLLLLSGTASAGLRLRLLPSTDQAFVVGHCGRPHRRRLGRYQQGLLRQQWDSGRLSAWEGPPPRWLGLPSWAVVQVPQKWHLSALFIVRQATQKHSRDCGTDLRPALNGPKGAQPHL